MNNDEAFQNNDGLLVVLLGPCCFNKNTILNPHVFTKFIETLFLFQEIRVLIAVGDENAPVESWLKMALQCDSFSDSRVIPPQAAPPTGEKQCNGHKRSFLSLADTRVREDIVTPCAKAYRTSKFGELHLQNRLKKQSNTTNFLLQEPFSSGIHNGRRDTVISGLCKSIISSPLISAKALYCNVGNTPTGNETTVGMGGVRYPLRISIASLGMHSGFKDAGTRMAAVLPVTTIKRPHNSNG